MIALPTPQQPTASSADLRPVVVAHGRALYTAIDTLDNTMSHDDFVMLAHVRETFPPWADSDDITRVNEWDERIEDIVALIVKLGGRVPPLWNREERTSSALIGATRRAVDPSWEPRDQHFLPIPSPDTTDATPSIGGRTDPRPSTTNLPRHEAPVTPVSTVAPFDPENCSAEERWQWDMLEEIRMKIEAEDKAASRSRKPEPSTTARAPARRLVDAALKTREGITAEALSPPKLSSYAMYKDLLRLTVHAEAVAKEYGKPREAALRALGRVIREMGREKLATLRESLLRLS